MCGKMWWNVCFLWWLIEVMGDLYYKVVCDGVFEFLKMVMKWDVNWRDEDGMILVYYVVSCGNVEVFRLLVGKG